MNKLLIALWFIFHASSQGEGATYPFNFPYIYTLYEEEIRTSIYYKVKTYEVNLRSSEVLVIVHCEYLNKQVYTTEKSKIEAIESLKKNKEKLIVKQKSGVENITGYDYYYQKCRKGKKISETRVVFRRDGYLLIGRTYILGTKLVFNLDSIYYKR